MGQSPGYPLPSRFQNSRPLERKRVSSMNHIVCTRRLGIVSPFHQLGNGVSPPKTHISMDQPRASLAGSLCKEGGLRPVMQTLLCKLAFQPRCSLSARAPGKKSRLVGNTEADQCVQNSAAGRIVERKQVEVELRTNLRFHHLLATSHLTSPNLSLLICKMGTIPISQGLM